MWKFTKFMEQSSSSETYSSWIGQKNFPHFIEQNISELRSQEPATGVYSEPDD